MDLNGEQPGTTAEMAPINKLTWAQVGRVTEPGRYMFKFGWLTITAEDLEVWHQYPDATFTLTKMTTHGEIYVDEFKLGVFSFDASSNSP